MESVDVFVKNQENKVYKSNFTFLIKRKAVILAAKSENVLSTKTIIIHLKQYLFKKIFMLIQNTFVFSVSSPTGDAVLAAN